MNQIYINPETGEKFSVSPEKLDQFLQDFPNAVLEQEKPEEVVTEMFVNPDTEEQFKVSVNKKDQFLKDFPNAIPIDQAGKETSPTLDAVAGKDKASNMVSKLQDGSLESPVSKEENTWIEDAFGKNEVTDFFGDLIRAGSSGFTQAEALDSSLKLFSKGSEMSQEERLELIKRGRAIEESGQTDEMENFSKVYAEKQKELGGVRAFFSAWFENPSVMTQYTVMSLANMAGSATEAEAMIAGAAGAGVGAAAGSFVPGVGTAAGAIGGLMGGLSATMEVGATTAQLMQEAATESGLDWASMDDKARLDWLDKVVNDKELYDDITNKALRRGITIGAVDAITGAATKGISGGVRKAVTKSAKSALAGAAEVTAAAIVETTGGLASEIGGQLAAGQELNAQEILTEGFADKTFTILNIAQGGLKAPNYTINGEKLNGKKFRETVQSMDDATIMATDISVDNDPLMDKIISNRRADINIDQKIGANINDVKDRAEVIKLQRDLQLLKDNDTVSGQMRKSDIKEKIVAIEEKYKNSKEDVTIKQRQEAVAKARTNKLENAFNKNVGAATKLSKDLSFEKGPKVYKTTTNYLKAIANKLGVTPEEAKKIADKSDGVFLGEGEIFIDKQRAMEVEAVSVGTHEILHPILNAVVGNKENQGNIVNEFKKAMTSKQRAYVDAQLTANVDPSNWDTEYLNYFSDGILKGKINYDQTLFERLGDVIIRIFKGKGFDNISFDNGRDVYNFLKEYNTSVKETGKVSSKAVEAIKAGEVKTGRKAATVGLATDIQASRNLNEEVDKLVGEKDDAGNYKFKSKEEFQSSDKFVDVYDKIISGRTIDPLIRKGIEGDQVYGKPIENFVEEVKDGLTEVIMRFDPSKNNSLIGFINSQLKFRKGDVLKKYKAQQTKSIDTAAGEVGSIAELEADDTSEAIFEESMAEEQRQSGLIKAEEILSKDFVKAATEEVVGKLTQITPKDLTFKNVKGLAVDTLAKEIGIPAKKIMDTTANMSSQEMGVSINWIKQHANQIAKIMPQGAVLDSASEKLLGTATGIANSILKNTKLYTKNSRIKKGPGLSPFVKNKNIKGEDVLNAIGIVNGEPKPGIGPRTPEGQAVKGILAMYEKLVSNSLLRQELIDQGESLNVIQDIGAGKSELMFSKNVASDLTLIGNKDNLLFIQFSKTKRAEYENILKKNRPDLKDIPKQVENLFEWADNLNVKDNKKAKYKKLALFYMNKGNLILPEDGYKVEEAIRLSEINKIDAYSFQNVDELIEKYTPVTKTARINPDTVKEFTNKKELTDSVVVYDVDPSKEGQIAVRKVVDSNWGEKANPWCLIARSNVNETNESFKMWKSYNRDGGGYKIAFQNGKLKAFRDGNNKNWWDRQDSSSKGIKIEGKIKKDGFVPSLELKEDGSKKIIGYQKGSLNSKNGEVITKNVDGVVTNFENYKNGVLDGYYLESNEYSEANITVEGNYVEGERDGTFTETITPIEVDDKNVGYVTVGRLDGRDDVDITSVTKRFAVVEYKKNKIFSQKRTTYASLLDSGEKIIYTAYGPYEGGIGIIEPYNGPKITKDENLQFSLSKEDVDLLNEYGIQSYTLESPADVPKYVNDIRKLAEIFNTDDFKLINKSAVNFGVKRVKNRETSELLTKELEELKNEGVLADELTTGRTKPQQHFGNKDLTKLKKYIENGKLNDYNEKHGAVFDRMWFKIKEVVENDRSLAVPILYFLSNSSTEPSNPHRMGAPIIGYELKSGKLLYEHAMQSTVAYQRLMKAVLDDNIDFVDEFNFVKENYKIIALTDDTASKLDKSGYKTVFEDSWTNWWQRYFNPKVAAIRGGIDPSKIYSIYTQQTLAEDYNITNKGAKEGQFSKNLNREFNDILQATTGVDSKKTYSKIGAEMAGSKKGRFDFFIPPGAEDFIGLIYKTLGKGEIGDRQLAWYKKNFFDPYARAMAAVTKDRVIMAQKFKDLRKQLNIVPKNLRKKLPGEGFTQEQAIRVYIWTKQGEKIPGLNEGDLSTLNDYVNKNPELKEFGDRLIAIAGKDAYVGPREGWTAGTITTDLLDTVNGSKRAMHLEQWQGNVDAVFTEENLNKLEALYGKSYRVALENILKRMKSGRNRLFTSDSLTGRFVDWISNSIGSIMFFNSRSAILQTISSINFINFTDNNIIAAGKALANPKQFASDFMTLMNSEFLVDRRNGLRINVNEADIANIAATSKNKAKAFISEMLKLGFLPTQIADSFAIASGGAAFYRNRINTYLKQGLNEKSAEQKAMRDFREIAEESQQSSRPDKISQQQAGPLGRIILAFANTPAQYARIIKKAALDLKNGRGDRKTNISKIVYYGVAQNLLFSAMQNALFALMFDGDEDEEKAEEENKKYGRVANSMADSLLRGMGFAGAVTSVVKNAALKIVEESNKDIPKYEKAAKELIKISPPISSKLSKVESALRSASWDRDKIKEAGLSIDNPAYMIGGKLSSAALNVPLDRALTKVDNIQNAMSKETEIWQKFALLAGWQSWELGIEDEDDKTKRGSTKRKTSERKTVKRKTVKRNK
mgnify:CR=1 FL=1